MASVSIVIVSFNTLELLDACIASVPGAAGGADVEMIVVDNDSRDGSADMVASRYPEVVLIRNAANVGFAVAVNQALRVATGTYALLLNSDATLVDDALGRMTRFMDSEPAVGVVGPQLRHADGRLQPSGRTKSSLVEEFVWSFSIYRLLGKSSSDRFLDPDRDYSLVADVDEVSGACMLLRRAMLDEIGLFHEGYFFCYEDIDLCLRANAAGWRVVYYPEAKVVHLWGQSTKKADRTLKARYIESYFEYLRRAHGRFVQLVFRALFFVKFGLKLAWAAVAYVLHPGSGTEPIRQGMLLLGTTVKAK